MSVHRDRACEYAHGQDCECAQRQGVGVCTEAGRVSVHRGSACEHAQRQGVCAQRQGMGV